MAPGDVVAWNKRRIKGLGQNSKLEEGTRLRVSPPNTEAEVDPYCHWTFPDSTLEDAEPSYMMVRRWRLTNPPTRTPTVSPNTPGMVRYGVAAG